jgi:putative ABC transport system ATP-binding protein
MSVLQLIGVTKDYPVGNSTFRALDNVDLEVEGREVVGIMGPSGAGKTTMLTVAGGLQRPTSGKVIVDGMEIQSLSQKELSKVRREKIGFVFQSFNLLQALTAVENVQYVCELAGYRGKIARARAFELLSMLGLEHRADEKPARLSGGEQQRVAIARAFANDSSIILADEPTANLDYARSIEVMETLRALSRDLLRPVVMVTHDLRTHHFADRLLWLESGHLELIGHEDVAERGAGKAAPASGEAVQASSRVALTE